MRLRVAVSYDGEEETLVVPCGDGNISVAPHHFLDPLMTLDDDLIRRLPYQVLELQRRVEQRIGR